MVLLSPGREGDAGACAAACSEKHSHKKTSSGGELTVAYMHAFTNTVTGPSALTSLGAGNFGTESLKMYQNSIGIAYGWKM